jgi:NADPH-dependent ferric siderophore reductase
MAEDVQNAPATQVSVQGTQQVRKRRPPPRPVEVVSVSKMAPRFVSVLFGGPALEGFRIEEPTAHIKVFLPAGGQTEPVLPTFGPDGLVWPEGATRPVVRTYTPRRFDDTTGTLEVQFLLHEVGPASDWAAQAKAGDRAAIGGPGGRFRFDREAETWWVGGDESALPAIGTLLDVLPASAQAEIHVEVAGPDDEIPLPSAARTNVTWHHRRNPEGWGEELDDAARSSSLAEGARVWIAGEAVAVRRVRKHFLEEKHVPVTSMTTRGYWRNGESDHPDGDYADN